MISWVLPTLAPKCWAERLKFILWAFIYCTNGFFQVCRVCKGLGTITSFSLFQSSVVREAGYASLDYSFRWWCLCVEVLLETSQSPEYAFSLGKANVRDEDHVLFSPVGYFVLFLPFFQYRKDGKLSDLIYKTPLFHNKNTNIATKKYGLQDSRKNYFQSFWWFYVE